jgi:putative acetyltransferase
VKVSLQKDISKVQPEDFPRVLEVWEASVRATHHFLSEADIQFFKPLIPDEIFHVAELACVRDSAGQVAGFVGVENGKIEMLFIHPMWRGQGVGSRLVRYAVKELEAVLVDVNEQNEQAVGFYRRMGFEVEGRSELDSTGKPFPLLHLRLIDLAGGPPSGCQAVIGGSIESTSASSSANR